MYADHALIFLQDFGDPMSWTPSAGGSTINGVALFDQGDAGAEGGSHISREYVITVETAAWPGLNRSEVVVITSPIGGIASYKLRSDLVQQDDGVFSTIKLTKVQS